VTLVSGAQTANSWVITSYIFNIVTSSKVKLFQQ
jgi:hypothetical protein